MKQISIITIHPSMIEAYNQFGVFKAAQAKRLAEIKTINLRDFAIDVRGSIDERPYGGGDGMVLRPEPLTAAIASLATRPLIVATGPGQKAWTHKDAKRFAALDRSVCFVCGRFAGIDQRWIDLHVDEQFSIGEFVVSGGELPVLCMIDTILRELDGVLGHGDSARLDSFSEAIEGGLEYPVYTRPSVYAGVSVPEVLLSGDHIQIDAWRKAEAKKRTNLLRPDLIKKIDNTKDF